MVKGAEDETFHGDVNPFRAIFTVEVLLVAFYPLVVDNIKTKANNDDRVSAKN